LQKARSSSPVTLAPRSQLDPGHQFFAVLGVRHANDLHVGNFGLV